mgnify:CR=1 FL=1
MSWLVEVKEYCPLVHGGTTTAYIKIAVRHLCGWLYLSGTHSVGRCRPENMRFDGPWDQSEFVLDNHYYQAMLAPGYKLRTLPARGWVFMSRLARRPSSNPISAQFRPICDPVSTQFQTPGSDKGTHVISTQSWPGSDPVTTYGQKFLLHPIQKAYRIHSHSLRPQLTLTLLAQLSSQFTCLQTSGYMNEVYIIYNIYKYRLMKSANRLFPSGLALHITFRHWVQAIQSHHWLMSTYIT